MLKSQTYTEVLRSYQNTIRQGIKLVRTLKE